MGITDGLSLPEGRRPQRIPGPTLNAVRQARLKMCLHKVEFKTEQPSRHARAYACPLPRKARPDMTLERDDTAERVARIDKLLAETKPTPAVQQITRFQAHIRVVSLPQGPALTFSRRDNS